VEFLLPLMFVVRERAHQTILGMWKVKGWIRLMRGSLGATGTRVGARKDRKEEKSFLKCDLGFPFLLLEFYVQTILQRRYRDRRISPCLNPSKRCARIHHRV